MKHLKNKVDIESYLDDILDPVTELDMFYPITAALAANHDPEAILEDFQDTLDTYYAWLERFVSEEEYIIATKIQKCIQIEIRHYRQLMFDVYKSDYEEELLLINNETNLKYFRNV